MGDTGSFITENILGLEKPEMPSMSRVPNANDAEVQKKMQAAAAAERKAQGRASTLLTGGTGDQSQATVSRRTLLGS